MANSDKGPGKGKTNNPNGRPKGTSNKSTEAAKIVLTQFVGQNMDVMQDLFDDIKKDNPKQAFDVLFSSLEYVLPKLSRAEHTGKDGEDIKTTLNINIIGEDD